MLHLSGKLPLSDLRNKTSVPMFYCGNKIWVQVRVHMN